MADSLALNGSSLRAIRKHQRGELSTDEFCELLETYNDMAAQGRPPFPPYILGTGFEAQQSKSGHEESRDGERPSDLAMQGQEYLLDGAGESEAQSAVPATEQSEREAYVHFAHRLVALETAIQFSKTQGRLNVLGIASVHESLESVEEKLAEISDAQQINACFLEDTTSQIDELKRSAEVQSQEQESINKRLEGVGTTFHANGEKECSCASETVALRDILKGQKLRMSQMDQAAKRQKAEFEAALEELKSTITQLEKKYERLVKDVRQEHSMLSKASDPITVQEASIDGEQDRPVSSKRRKRSKVDKELDCVPLSKRSTLPSDQAQELPRTPPRSKAPVKDPF